MTTNESIFANINCKGGVALLVGVIVKQTEKAVQINYAIEPIFVGTTPGPTFVNRAAWIPKSQIQSDGRGAWNIKEWFANKVMKGIHIKPYKI